MKLINLINLFNIILFLFVICLKKCLCQLWWFRAAQTTVLARTFCEEYHLFKTGTFSIRMYSEELAHDLALVWCHILPFILQHNKFRLSDQRSQIPFNMLYLMHRPDKSRKQNVWQWFDMFLFWKRTWSIYCLLLGHHCRFSCVWKYMWVAI